MRYYVVADVHGFYTEMITALKEKGYFEDKEPHKLIVCGDLFDRGTEAKQMQRFMLDLFRRDEVILIKGNHEDLAVDLLRRAHHYLYNMASALGSNHYTNGTIKTFCDLTDWPFEMIMGGVDGYVYDGMHTPFYRELIPGMVDYFETPHYVFVHGWIPCRASNSSRGGDGFSPLSDWRNASDSDWERARWYNGMKAYAQGVREPGKTIVCGHWHASYGHSKIEGKGTEFGEGADFSPFVADGIIALDAFTVQSGTVNCIVIDD